MTESDRILPFPGRRAPGETSGAPAIPTLPEPAPTLEGVVLLRGGRRLSGRAAGSLHAAPLLCAGAGELLHAATIAIVSQVTLDTLWHAVPAFPTISEFWLRFLEIYGL